MHIVFVTNELNDNNGPQGGLGTFVANMSRVFSSKGHKVKILLVTTKPLSTEFDKNVEVHNLYVRKNVWEECNLLSNRLECGNEKKQVHVRVSILNIIKSELVQEWITEQNNKERIDIVHFANHGAFSRFLNMKIPYVIRVSGLLNIIEGGANKKDGSIEYSDNPLSIIDMKEMDEIERAKKVVCPSYLMANILRGNKGIDATVIESPFLLSEEEWDPKYFEELEDKEYVLYYGTCSYLKGISVIANLIYDFLLQHPKMLFVICGRDTEIENENGEKTWASEYIMEKAGEFSDRVVYEGLLLRRQLYPIIKNARACILPSRIENLSNACIEAMALGTVVVATKGASYEQLIDDGESGFLCERDKECDFLNALSSAVGLCEDRRQSMLDNAFSRVEDLSPEKIYENYYDYYKEVIADWEN